jgi:hypothetical protein
MTNNENDLGFVKLNMEKIMEIYELYKEEPVNENLQKKASDLINNYNCFVSNYDAKSLWEKKKMIQQKKNTKYTHNNVRNKPRVILIDFCDEMKCKKEFISYLNKLTDVNKEIIYNKISLFIKELNNEIQNSLFDVLINFIKISSNNIYIDVLFLFDINYINSNINNYFKNFIENKLWLPKEIIVDCKILYDNDNYDKYCSYIKLKKNVISLIKAFIIIFKKLDENNNINQLLHEIYNDITTYIINNNYKHIIELLLDELLIILEYMPNKEIIENIKQIDINKFEYSTKFKLMKIFEYYRNNE